MGREAAGQDTLSARSVPLLPIRDRDVEGVCRHQAEGAGSVGPVLTVTNSYGARQRTEPTNCGVITDTPKRSQRGL